MGKTEVENLILVVEGDIGKAKSIPPDSLRKELARVVAQDGFLVYQTPNLQETMKLYQNMHKWARKRYSKRTFKQLVYQKETIQEWNERMKRIQAPCMEDVFWQMMLQIPGFGRTKIQKVINNKGIRTFSEFLKLYEDCPTPENGERLLLELIPRSHTGIDLSRKMYYLFTDRMYFDQRFTARKHRRIDSSLTGTKEDSRGGDNRHQLSVSREVIASSRSLDATRSGGQSPGPMVPKSQQHVIETGYGGSQQTLASSASASTYNAPFSPRDQFTEPVAPACIGHSTAVKVVTRDRPEEYPPAEAIASKNTEDDLIESERPAPESSPAAIGNSSDSPNTEDPVFIDLEPRTSRDENGYLPADIDTMPERKYDAVEQDELIILE
uniref:Crossover junction endonuclease MUS81 n=1 Tax=Rhodosorus marinus TaxID=101924 RepID=A0A7S2ZQG7_9RHOD|mmetsp:Transcript_25303/g.99926  ORF Transcript_25303/g.99926 Transcript_25303/m.99926 type:complete len:382 (+) Transcript_25303:1544-2689(+)